MREAILRKFGKKWLIAWVIAASVLSIGSAGFYAQKAYADQCSINGRDCYIGYFFGGYDGGPPATGTRFNVLSSPAMLGVNNADDLVNNVRSHMACAGGTLLNAGEQNATGSAFIILTMLGYAPGTSKNVACQVFNEWADTVRAWAPNTNYNVFYDFGGLNTRSTKTDVAYYPSAQSQAWSIVFYNPANGQPLYAIKKDCANPVGRLQAIPKNYTLTPHVDSVTPTQIEAGSKMNVTSGVDTTGEVNSRNTQWEITLITVKPGKKAPHEDEGPTISTEAPCQAHGGAPSGNYFQSGDADCRNASKGSGTFNLGSPSQNLKPGANGVDIGDVPVGTRICFALSVQPRSNSDNAWGHSKPVCTTVGKKPKLQIWGGDIGVRGHIDTSTSVKNVSGTSHTFGSWVEYGAFSVGVNNRFASASGLAEQTINDQSAWSKLTFANKDDDGVTDAFGEYTSGTGFRPLPGVAEYFATIADKQPISSPTVDPGTLTFATGGAVTVHTAGDVTLTGGTIGKGRSVVIIASGTVTIAGPITYADETLTKLQDIPQVVIIAKNINIQEGVSRVDAWLVAKDTINTCSNFAGTKLTSGKCGSLLEVNGPVVTNRLILNRTAGSGTGEDSGDPAERFNLRPDAYLWAQLLSRGGNKAQTVYSTELPPRF